MTIYPKALAELLRICAGYRNGTVDLDRLKISVWGTAQTIVALEEKELREFLQQADGELELIQFTTGKGEMFPATVDVVARIEAEVQRWL